MKTGLNQFLDTMLDWKGIPFVWGQGLRVLSSYFSALVLGLLESAHCDNCPTKKEIFFLLWLLLLCFFPDNQRMFWQLTLRSVLCGAANSLTSTTKPFHGGVLKIEDNDPLPLTGGRIRMFFDTSHYPFLNMIWPQNQLFSGPWTSMFSRLKVTISVNCVFLPRCGNLQF